MSRRAGCVRCMSGDPLLVFGTFSKIHIGGAAANGVHTKRDFFIALSRRVHQIDDQKLRQLFFLRSSFPSISPITNPHQCQVTNQSINSFFHRTDKTARERAEVMCRMLQKE